MKEFLNELFRGKLTGWINIEKRDSLFIYLSFWLEPRNTPDNIDSQIQAFTDKQIIF